MTRHLLPLILACATGACGSDTLPPIARIAITPATLCEGVEPQRVTLDATVSLAFDGSESDELTYAWSFYPEPTEITRGDLFADLIVARFEATRPIRARLQVAAADGPSAEQTAMIGITRTTLTPCAEGCLDSEICISLAGTSLCADERDCDDDDDCEPCLVCRPDELGTPRCVPP